MRIRKNRTSSRVIPEFCLTHGAFEKVKLDQAEFNSQQLESITRIAEPSLDGIRLDDKDVHTCRSHSSLQNECTTSTRTRDIPRGNAGLGGCKNHQCYSAETRQSNGSESDAGRKTDSLERTSKQQRSHGMPPKSPAPLMSDKVKSDASSKPMGNRKKFDHKEAPGESEVTRDSLEKLTTVSVTGNANGVTGRRKRHRSKMEPDSDMVQKKKGTAMSNRSVGEVYAREPAVLAADMEVSSGMRDRKLIKVEEESYQGTEGTDKSPASACFPAGWAYRGLAQIAEQDKPSQGKQCGRTDGRSWRCPLKVQEGFTLCEHHLSKFRLKKLSKESKRQKSSHRRSRQRQQQQQQQQQLDLEEDEKQEQQLEQETHDSACDENESVKSAQTLLNSENDVPMRSRRKHRTVKLSVL
ncbi:hypothetical protein R1flu_011914 [Riccia fluitans]|uniref:WRC domain-containing protein n=1 Tax=Riccia fluitans TaxID=41844 RepID=A0ABD1ZDA6_9MARC